MIGLPREMWISALSAVQETELTEVVDALPRDWEVRPKAIPQAGLGILKMRDGAVGDVFYLGEFPMASCWVTVTTKQGDCAEGAALVMDDREERAAQMALCDAVLSARLPGWERVAKLVERGVKHRRALSRDRKAMLARTRVEFSLLEDVGADDA